MSAQGPTVLLEVRGLGIDVHAGRIHRRVVDGVDLTVHAGECVGVVGESGSGKSLTMRAVIGLLPRAAALAGGSLRFADADGELTSYDPARLRGHGIAMVFQEPMTALNPTRRVGDSIADAVIAGRHERVRRPRARERAVDLMREVGIPDPGRRARAYPHELSGGLRQRVMIAMALAGDPQLLICDEPTTALDVTVQDQILGLLDRLRVERGLGLLFVTHDLAVISQVSQRIAVMKDGRVVEDGRTRDVLDDPRHPYTVMLRDAVTALEGRTPKAPVS